MILAFIGGVMILFAVFNESLNWIVLVIGIVLVILGLLAIAAGDENSRSRANRTRYWAYGEQPDWKNRVSTRTDFRKHCPECGKPVGRSAKYCSHCGRAV